MKQSVDFGHDDHPEDDPERPRAWWIVAVTDDCDGCQDLRVELTVELGGEMGERATAHFNPETARRVRAAITSALREIGADTE
jgi:hypothetical protein